MSRRHRASIHLVRVVVSRDARTLVEGNAEPRDTAAFVTGRLEAPGTATNGRLVKEGSAHQGRAAVEWTAARVGNSLDHCGVLCDAVTCEERCVWPAEGVVDASAGGVNVMTGGLLKGHHRTALKWRVGQRIANDSDGKR